MTRAQAGVLVEGVIPTQYKRITAVNAAGLGSIEDDYPVGHPQERYGAWTLPPNAPVINLPLGIRLTSATGEQTVNELVITNWTRPRIGNPGVLVYRHRDTVYYALIWRCGKWSEIDIVQENAEWAPSLDLHLLNLYCSVLG
ncbi:uncharacterized protein PAC_01033 [Phialocephala subalpina]|uniref:Uncharacterized protein n=1 Tax=Phialocephala subalpina TaxID=576137 RepID=A0A1L7WEL2_9HELO|nr:uncharacterized protein PAC_01033 [Phialocephala subalpina]